MVNIQIVDLIGGSRVTTDEQLKTELLGLYI